MKIADVISRVCDGLEERDNRAFAEAIVRATVRELGLEVNSKTGEVYNPAPKPAEPWEQRQRNVRYPGMRRRR